MNFKMHGANVIVHNIKHFDDMALSRLQTAKAYAAHGMVVTLVRLDTAGIKKHILHTALPSAPPSILSSNSKHYSVKALGFQTAENDDLRGAGRG